MRRLRALAALIALLALAIGVPVVLVAIAGFPLPTRMPDWSHVRQALQQRDIPSLVVIRTIVTLVWIAWAQLAWGLVWEVLVNVRNAPAHRAPRRAPFVPGAFTIGIGRLVATVLAVGIVATSFPKVALAQRPAVAAGAAPPPPRQPAVTAPAVAIAEPPRWCAASGDTLWDMAVTALGDGSRVSEIFELNPSIGSARNLQIGTVVRLPSDARVPADRAPVPALVVEPKANVAEVSVPYLPGETIAIQKGDNLWRLSEQRLERANDHTVSDAEIIEYLHDVEAVNADIIEDPDLIYPGEQFKFRTIGTAPTPPVEPTAVPPYVPPVVTTPATIAALPSLTVLPPPTTSTPTSTVPAPPAPQVVSGRPAVDEANRSPWLLGLGGATVLASGLLVVYRRLRRRQAVSGARAIIPTPVSPELKRVESALIAAADVSLVTWAAHELNTVLTDPRVAASLTSAPVAVELSAAHGIEILWDAPSPDAPSPWESSDQGWAWRLDYDPEHEMPATPSSAPIPGLVTIGQRDGNQLLIDLEACGSLALTGDAARTEDLLRVIVLELAHDDDLANAYVHLVGIELEGIEHSSRVIDRTEAEAIDHVRSAVADTEAILTAGGMTTTFQLRTRHDPTGRELTVIVAKARVLADVDALVQLASPHRGVAVVVLGGCNARSTISIDADGDASIDPLGVSFVPAGIPAATAGAVAALLDDAADVHVVEAVKNEPAAVGELVAEAPEEVAEESIDDEAADAIEEAEIVEPAVLVRVLGPPAIPTHPKLKPTDLNLVTYMACRGPATADQIIDAVWNGQRFEPSNFWNHLSKARTALSSRFVPARDQAATHIRLNEGVGTDLQLFEALASRAASASSGEAISLLTRAIDLIEGVPFDAPGYDWAHQQQFHAHACRVIEDAVVRLVDFALEADDIDGAHRATAQGLKAIPLNEPMYRARMRIEAHAGNPAGVKAVYNELIRLMTDLDGEPYEPDSKTKCLLTDFVSAQVG